MNKVRSCRKTVWILVVIAIVLLAVGIYGMTRPMSYGSDYYHASFYEGEDFSGTMTFYPDNTMVLGNANLDEEMKLFYYYKDGYVRVSISSSRLRMRLRYSSLSISASDELVLGSSSRTSSFTDTFSASAIAQSLSFISTVLPRSIFL